MRLLFQVFFFAREEKQPNGVSQRELGVCFGQTGVERYCFLEQLNDTWVILFAFQMRGGAPRDDSGVLEIRLSLRPTLAITLRELALDHRHAEKSQGD